MDVLREAQWLVWVGAALALGLIEVASLDLVFAMLTVGAVTAAAVAFLGGSFTVQVLVFAGTSGLLLAVVRPLAVRRLHAATPAQRTGTDANVGQSAEVLTAVTDRGGEVKLRGEVWSARAGRRGETYPPGTIVTVVSIDGATAVVSGTPDETAPDQRGPS
jgi:membrane protein implicated in regulation of membrane protease activity